MNRSPRPESPQHAGPALAAPRDASVRAERAVHLGPADVLEGGARLEGSPLVEVALTLRECGINPIHLKHDKTPWEKHSLLTRAWPDVASMRRKFGSRETLGIGMACGAVSGNLEALDFESVDSFEAWCGLASEYGFGDVVARIRAGYCVRTFRGYHLAYRIEGGRADKPLKLALGPDRKALIETRGQGSYVVAPPSPLWDTSSSRAPGGHYAFESGGFASIATITADERHELHNLARALTHATDPSVDKGEFMLREPRGIYEDERPSDRFDQRADWNAILGPHGWKRLGTDGQGMTYWRRPGKDRGVSATTGVRQGGGEALFVFTTSTTFEAWKGRSPFWAYCHLEHGDDPSAAGKALAAAERALAPDVTVGVDLSGFEPLQADVAPAEAKPKATDSIPSHLYDLPGPMGGLFRHIVDTAPRPQPELALGAVIAAQATIAGRKVARRGLRTNLYVMGVASSGSGKDHPSEVVKDLFASIGAAHLIGAERIGSDAAILETLADKPVSLFCLDEIGDLLERIGSPRAPEHLKAQVSVLLSLYTAKRTATKIYADTSREREILLPNLSILGISAPEKFYGALSSADVGSGLLGRFLVFTSPTFPRHRDPEIREIPEDVIDHFRRWHEWQHPDVPSADRRPLYTHLPQPPQLLEVPETTEGASILREFRERIEDRIADSKADEEFRPILARCSALAVKLALVWASGRSVDRVEIDAPAARWGTELASFATDAFIRELQRRLGSNERERMILEVQQWIEAQGVVPTAKFTRKFKKLDRRVREDIVRDLVDSGLVTIRESGNTGGRPRRDILWKKA